jgi:hypothetical protein
MQSRLKSILEIYQPFDGFEVILPIDQCYEPDVGKGLCFGYTMYWAVKLIEKKHPFNINSEKKPLPFNFSKPLFSTAYNDLNNLARQYRKNKINSIKEYQKDQQILMFGMNISSGRNIFNINKTSRIPSIALTNQQFFQQLSCVADQHNNIPLIITLKILNSYGVITGGHAIGLYKVGNNLNYFDCNFGWFNFKSKEAFGKWLEKWCHVYNILGGRMSPFYSVYCVSLAEPSVDNVSVKTPLQYTAKYFYNNAIDFIIPRDIFALAMASFLIMTIPSNKASIISLKLLLLTPYALAMSNFLCYSLAMVWKLINNMLASNKENYLTMLEAQRFILRKNKYPDLKTDKLIALDDNLVTANRLAKRNSNSKSHIPYGLFTFNEHRANEATCNKRFHDKYKNQDDINVKFTK